MKILSKMCASALLLTSTLYASQAAYPGTSLTSQSGFGLNQGQAFIGIGVTDKVNGKTNTTGAMVFGLGFGNSTKTVGFEVDTIISSIDTRDGGFGEDGNFNVKVHKLINSTTAISAGVEGIADWGTKYDGKSYYIALTKAFFMPNALIIGIGFGDGRFLDNNHQEDTVDAFASISYDITSRISAILDYTGGITKIGCSFVPFKDTPLVATIYADDIAKHSGATATSASLTYALNY